MKKVIAGLLCVLLLFAAAACGDNDTPADAPSTDLSGIEGGATAAPDTTGDGACSTAAGETTAPDGTTTKRPTATDNVVNWDEVFGEETTAAGKTTTTTTAKPTTTTTLAPTLVNKISLPAVGTDVDGRGRIKVSQVKLDGSALTITIHNYTDEQKSQWITEETNYVTYACYDSAGKQLAGKGDFFGYLYIGCLEAGEEFAATVTLPKGTAAVVITGAKIVYWTPWK